MKRNSGFANLFLIIVIVIIGIGGLLYYSWQKGLIKTIPRQETLISPNPTATPDEAANWKTYTSTEGQFSFQYPNDWKAALTKHVFDLVALVNRTDLDEYEFSIGTLPEANPTMSRCMKQIISEQIGIDNFPTQKIILRNDLDYQEDDGYLCYNATREELPEITQISFDSNNKQYLLRFIYPISKSEEAQQILNQILSTFKFINKESLSGKYFCETDVDCTKYIGCNEECVSKNWAKENSPTVAPGAACVIEWEYGCKCISNKCQVGKKL